MNTINNSNTKHFCRDCKNTSTSSCKNGCGDSILPCYILRKMAVKCTSVYNKCYKNEDNNVVDFYDEIRNWCGFSHGIKYLNNLQVRKELIMLAMSYIINSHTGNNLDFINEFSDDIELSNSDRIIVERLYILIACTQAKINKEWFAISGNKEYYLSQIKKRMNKLTRHKAQ